MKRITFYSTQWGTLQFTDLRSVATMKELYVVREEFVLATVRVVSQLFMYFCYVGIRCDFRAMYNTRLYKILFTRSQHKQCSHTVLSHCLSDCRCHCRLTEVCPAIISAPLPHTRTEERRKLGCFTSTPESIPSISRRHIFRILPWEERSVFNQNISFQNSVLVANYKGRKSVQFL